MTLFRPWSSRRYRLGFGSHHGIGPGMPQPLRSQANVRSSYFTLISVYSLSIDSCGNVGKLTRIADAVSNAEFAAAYPRKNPQAPFLVLGGFVDFLTPSIFANAHGAITGLGNVAPVRFCRFLRSRYSCASHSAHLEQTLPIVRGRSEGPFIAPRSPTPTRHCCSRRLHYCQSIYCRH